MGRGAEGVTPGEEAVARGFSPPARLAARREAAASLRVCVWGGDGGCHCGGGGRLRPAVGGRASFPLARPAVRFWACC